MRTILFSILIFTALFMVGCGGQPDDQSEQTNDNETVIEDNVSYEQGGENMEQNDNEALTLQVLKQDEDEGITIENNEIYQVIQETVDEDPYMGDENDLSLYPFDIVEYEDETSSLLFLVINRLDNPIRNLIFTLTFGNNEGDYIFEDHVVDLPEDYLGVLDKNGVVPILVDIEGDHRDLFDSLTQENVYLNLDDVGIDFVE